MFLKLVNAGVTPDFKALTEAIHGNHVAIIRFIRTNTSVDPSFNNQEALLIAATLGHFESTLMLTFHPKIDICHNLCVVFHLAHRDYKFRAIKALMHHAMADVSELCLFQFLPRSMQNHVMLINKVKHRAPVDLKNLADLETTEWITIHCAIMKDFTTLRVYN